MGLTGQGRGACGSTSKGKSTIHRSSGRTPCRGPGPATGSVAIGWPSAMAWSKARVDTPRAGGRESRQAVRQAVGGQRRRLVHELEVQVRLRRVARRADQAEDLAALHLLASPHPHGARLQVRVQRIAALAQVEHDMVAVGLRDRQVRRQASRRRVRQSVEGHDHPRIGYRMGRLAVDGVTGGVLRIADDDAALCVELLPVDGVALGDVQAPVQRQAGVHVARVLAAAVAGDVARAAQRCVQHQVGRAADGRAPGDEVVTAGSCAQLHAVVQRRRRSGVRAECQVHIQHAELRCAQPSGLCATLAHHQARAELRGVEAGEHRAAARVQHIEDLEVYCAAGAVGQLDLVDEVQAAVRPLAPARAHGRCARSAVCCAPAGPGRPALRPGQEAAVRRARPARCTGPSPAPAPAPGSGRCSAAVRTWR